jgi:hypothetical protein
VAEREERKGRALPIKSMAEKIKVQMGGGNSFAGLGRSNRGGTILRASGGRMGGDFADGGRSDPGGTSLRTAGGRSRRDVF